MSSEQDPKQYLVARIREALAEDGRINELNVDVSIAGMKIVLTGHVASDERRDSITEVVKELAPDYEVMNQTSVGTFPAADEAESL